ncbi:MAG TPA: extracellular solute-binding protein [Candidatus Binatia bacterium]|jgi:iron(III) transport system substrate-binding protein
MQKTISTAWILALTLGAFLSYDPAHFAGAAEQPVLVEGARKEGGLMIYSLLAVPDHSKIVDRFKQKYPFLEVSLIRPGASERITARVMTEARAARHSVDVIGVSRLNMFHLIQRGLVMSYDSPERRQFDAAFKDKKGFWTAFYVNPEVMSYNTKLVPPAAAPKRYQDLLDPRWKGKLVLEQTAVEWFAALLQHWGEDKALAYMRRLAEQNLKTIHGNTLITQLIAAGEHEAAVTLNGPRVELTKRRGAPIDWVALDPTVVDIVTMGIAAQAPHPNAAKLYLDFVLSREVQEGLLEEQFVKPSGRADVKSAFMAKLRGARVQFVSVDETIGDQWERYEKLFPKIFNVH